MNGSSLRLDAVSSSVSAVCRRSGRRPLQAVALRRGNLLLFHPLPHGESAAQTQPDLRSGYQAAELQRHSSSSSSSSSASFPSLRPSACRLSRSPSSCFYSTAQNAKGAPPCSAFGRLCRHRDVFLLLLLLLPSAAKDHTTRLINCAAVLRDVFGWSVGFVGGGVRVSRTVNERRQRWGGFLRCDERRRLGLRI